jgi:cell division initiation protein
MDLSPNDVRSYEFRSQMRGYDKAEVDSFINQVAAALDEVKQNNLKLSIENESLRSQVSGLKQFEDTIKSCAIDARRNADLTMASAKQEAAMLIAKAKQEAESIVVNRTREISEIEAKITRLGLTKKSYLNKIRSLIQSHLDIVDDVDSGALPSNEREEHFGAAESSDVAAGQREMVSQQTQVMADEAESREQEGEYAADESDNGVSGRVDDRLAAQLKDVIQDEAPAQPPASIDPELAAALESYKRAAARKAVDETAKPSPVIAPALGTVVETNLTAEDIPAGFVAKNGEVETGRATDKVQVSARRAQAVEPNTLHGFNDSDGVKAPLSPDKLAQELDEVAARFEEEMNRASKG